MIGFIILFSLCIARSQCCSIGTPSSWKSVVDEKQSGLKIDLMKDILTRYPNYSLKREGDDPVLHFTSKETRNVTISSPVVFHLVKLLLNDAFFAVMVTFKHTTPGRQCILSIRDNQIDRSILAVTMVHEVSHSTIRVHRAFVAHRLETRLYLRTRPIGGLRPHIWNHLMITSNRAGTHVFVNCRHIRASQTVRTAVAPTSWFVEIGVQGNDTVSSSSKLVGFVGQKNETQNYWSGELKEFLLTTDRSIPREKCPQMRQWKTEAKSHQIELAPSMDALQPYDFFTGVDNLRTVPVHDLGQLAVKLEQLQTMVMEQSLQIQTLTAELAQLRRDGLSVSQCQCFPRCALAPDGQPFPLGARWSPERCVNCECTLHGTNCTRTICPVLNCSNPLRLDDECCAHCPRDCIFMNRTYFHGEGVIQGCVRCICQNGTMNCKQLNPEHFCPKLKCPASMRVRPPNQCCEVCRKLDLCSLKRNLCDPLAVCRSHGLKYNCTCPPGYQGNGKFRRRSSITKHIATQDGCAPICPGGCRNGGKCVQPKTCQCASGFMGANCEYDLNECQLGSHNCTRHAMCLNLPGTYACVCRPGYTPDRPSDLPIVIQQSDSVILASKTNVQDRLGKNCAKIQSCAHKQDVNSSTCPADTICVTDEHRYQCLPRRLLNVLPNFWSFLPVDFEFEQLPDRRPCILEHIVDGRPELIHLPSEHFVINPWSRNHYCPLCQCQDGTVWCPNSTQKNVEHLGRILPHLHDLKPTEWPGFYPCPHCQSDSSLRFNWTQNCCSFCRPDGLTNMRESSRRQSFYTWMRKDRGTWAICYDENEATTCKKLQCPVGKNDADTHSQHCAQVLQALSVSKEVSITCPGSKALDDSAKCFGCACEDGRYTCNSNRSTELSDKLDELRLQCNSTMIRVIRHGLLIPVQAV